MPHKTCKWNKSEFSRRSFGGPDSTIKLQREKGGAREGGDFSPPSPPVFRQSAAPGAVVPSSPSSWSPEPPTAIRTHVVENRLGRGEREKRESKRKEALPSFRRLPKGGREKEAPVAATLLPPGLSSGKREASPSLYNKCTVPPLVFLPSCCISLSPSRSPPRSLRATRKVNGTSVRARLPSSSLILPGIRGGFPVALRRPLRKVRPALAERENLEVRRRRKEDGGAHIRH